MKPSTFALALLATFAGPVSLAENWPGWRGPRGDGTSHENTIPLHWGASSNVVWKIALPGAGHASPIVWEDRVFTVSAVEDSEERVLFCLDRSRGKILWRKAVIRAPFERKHTLNSHASGTPATDGEAVYTAFLEVDAMVVTAHDFHGHQRWQARPGEFRSVHGFCTSPILFRDKVILNGDHDGDGYIVALARDDGRELWRTPRPNRTRSYCAPTIFEIGGRTQMVLSGTECVASYDPDNGKLHWIIDGPTEQFVASIVYNPGADLFFVTGGFPEHHLLGVRPNGRGNVTETHVAWHHERALYAAYVPSPISEADYFLVVSDPGYACCFEARTGKLMWREKLGQQHASLVSASGRVYFLNDLGVTHVVKPGPDYDLVARNELGEKCYASPALTDGRIFIRGFEHLYCIGAEGR